MSEHVALNPRPSSTNWLTVRLLLCLLPVDESEPVLIAVSQIKPTGWGGLLAESRAAYSTELCLVSLVDPVVRPDDVG